MYTNTHTQTNIYILYMIMYVYLYIGLQETMNLKDVLLWLFVLCNWSREGVFRTYFSALRRSPWDFGWWLILRTSHKLDSISWLNRTEQLRLCQMKDMLAINDLDFLSTSPWQWCSSWQWDHTLHIQYFYIWMIMHMSLYISKSWICEKWHRYVLLVLTFVVIYMYGLDLFLITIFIWLVIHNIGMKLLLSLLYCLSFILFILII